MTQDDKRDPEISGSPPTAHLGGTAHHEIWQRLTTANAISLPAGAGVINFEQVQITQLQAQAVMDNPAGNYFNMHTPLNPGGAIRGQLTRVK